MAVGLLCPVCKEKEASYTCPRCNAKYCSSACYSQHSQRCTEAFQRSHAKAELSGKHASEDERKQMEEILLRMHHANLDEAESSDSDESDDLNILSEETLDRLQQQGEDLSELNISLDDFNKEEQEKFMQALANGSLNKYISVWEPWWKSSELHKFVISKAGTPLVQEENSYGKSVPFQLPSQALPPLKTLTNTPPSPKIKWQILDLLHTYALSKRVFNGDWENEPDEVLKLVILASPLLQNLMEASAKKKTEQNIEEEGSELLQSLQTKALHGEILGRGKDSNEALQRALDDCIDIFKLERKALLVVLNEFRILVQSLSEIEKSKKSKQKLFILERKLYFLLVWSNEQSSQVWDELTLCCQEYGIQAKNNLGISQIQFPGISQSVNSKSKVLKRPIRGSLITEL